MTYISGKNSVLEAVKNNVDIEKIYVTKWFKFSNQNIKIEIISKEKMDELSQENHQGFLAKLKFKYNYYPVEKVFLDQEERILILDHIVDPHNLGAIIRTANASGIKQIVIPNDRAANINETVVKVASGGINNLKITKVQSLQVFIDKLKKNNYWIYATAIDNGVSYKKTNYNYPMALIVGNEGKGVSKTLLKQSDQNVFIPMFGSVQSLNVSTATAILLFDLIDKK